MSKLTTEPNIADPDGFFEELLARHDGLSSMDSSSLNARLILVLANHIGSIEILSEAMDVAVNAKNIPS